MIKFYAHQILCSSNSRLCSSNSTLAVYPNSPCRRSPEHWQFVWYLPKVSFRKPSFLILTLVTHWPRSAIFKWFLFLAFLQMKRQRPVGIVYGTWWIPGVPSKYCWRRYVPHQGAKSPGFPATLEIRENLKNEFPIFQSGKTQGIWEKHKKSGKTQGICDSDPEGTGFRQFGVCASCAMCPSCVYWLTGSSDFCEYYTPLQTITVGAARTTSWLPSNLIKGKIFLMEFWNFLREISGKTQGISFP